MRESMIAWNKHLSKIISGEAIMCECDNGCGEKFIYGDTVYKVDKFKFVCEDCIEEYLDEGECKEDYEHELCDDDIEEPDPELLYGAEY